MLPTVVLEVGSTFTRIGFAGEASPLRTVRSPRFHSKQNAPSKAEWEILLYPFVRDCFLDHLLVSPAESAVVLCENMLTPQPMREALATVLLRRLRVPAITFLQSEAMCVCSTRVLQPPPQHALVVMIGYAETRVLPVIFGHTLPRALTVSPLAMRNVHNSLRVLCSAVPLPSSSWEEAVAQCCYVHDHDLAVCQRQISAAGVVHLKLPQAPFNASVTDLTITPEARAKAYDVLFSEDNENSFQRTIFNCILKYLLLAGGGSVAPGIHWRLLQELEAFSEKAASVTEYKTLSGLQKHWNFAVDADTAVSGAISSWTGASLMAVTLASSLAITLEDLEESSTLPDWTHISSLHTNSEES